MLSSLLWRPLRPADPTRTYFLLGAGSSFFFALAFTLSQVYYFTVVGLSPLEMVLVGTVLEATCFVFEVPTGVVADLWSRRLSVIIGVVLIGLAILLQGIVPTITAVLAAQVIWGLGYTFTSGADEAWITDEIGEDQVARVFTREQQLGLGLTFVATVLAGVLGLVSLRLPMVLAGAGFLVLAVVLHLVMPEANFQRTAREDRETVASMVDTLRDGLSVARRRPVVRSLFLVGLFVGLSSEAFDRLWSVRVLSDFTLPSLWGLNGPVVWFTIFALIGTLISLVVSLVVNRAAPGLVQASHPNWLLAFLVTMQVLAVAAVALLGNLWLAVAAVWGRDAAGALAAPIRSAWLNRNLDSRSRATVISMDGQVDAIGQVVGGPPLGVLANRTSTPTALLVSALVLAPAIALYGRLRPPPAQRPGTEPTADGTEPTAYGTEPTAYGTSDGTDIDR